MPKTLFIVNPNAGGGRGKLTWQRVQPLLDAEAQNYSVAMTRFAEDVEEIIAQATVDGIERVISIGGDGTTNVLVNALMRFNQQRDKSLVYGTIPAGTGRDGARSMGIPLKTDEAIRYVLNDATPQPIDVGKVTFDSTERYFLNISSAGIGTDVVERVEANKRHGLAYFWSVVQTLLQYTPQAVSIELDGDLWFEGETIITAVANGSYFGQGIHIAPDAVVDDGQFAVVVVEDMPLLSLARKFPSIYSGTHTRFAEVHTAHATQVRVRSLNGQPIPLELDGEIVAGDTDIRYEICPAALTILR